MNPSSTLARVIRSLRRSPGFVAIATLSMGVALGISTSVFAVMDATTHPEPPFRDVDQLMTIDYGIMIAHPPPAKMITGQVVALDGVDRIVEWKEGGFEFVLVAGRYISTSIAHVAVGYFDLLGVRPRLGRLFTEADHQTGDVAVVTDQVWRRDFNNRANIGDATVQVDGRGYRVVGVLPSGTDRSLRPNVFVAGQPPVTGWSGLLVRLKPGVSVDAFQTQVKSLNQRLIATYSGPKDRGIRAYIRPLRPDPLMVQDFHRAMVGAAVCILLIACANVAALMLARGLTKKRDYALRLALGAHPRQIGSEVIAEVGLIALAGCVTGVIVTSWFVGLIDRAMPVEMEWRGFVHPQWSWRVLVSSMIAVVVSIFVAGGFPAWMAARTDPAGPLKDGASSTTGRSHTRFRWLVVTELAVAMTLLMSTSLMLKSIRGMEHYEFGYPTDRLIIAAVGAGWRQDSTTLEEAERRRQQGLDVIRHVPGVEAVSLGIRENCGVIASTIYSDRSAEGGPTLNLGSNAFRSGGCTRVGPHFFSTVKIPIVDGRDFEEGDLTGEGGAIVDEKTARQLFPHERAVGRTVKLGGERSSAPWYTVIGIVKSHMLEFDTHPEMGANSGAVVYLVSGAPRGFTRSGQAPRGSLSMAFYARVAGNTDSVALQVARVLEPLTPSRGRSGVTRWDYNFQGQLCTEGFLALVFTLLGLASLVLGSAGLFAVISYVVGQRMREFAVRFALGASRDNVIKLVLRDGFLMAIGGTGIGAGFGMWAAFLLWDRMWGVYPVDVEALVIAEATLIVVTMLACLLPALRASKSDPLEIIRAA